MYDKTKTFNRAEQELDKAVKEKKKKIERSNEEKELDKFWGEKFKEPVELIYIVMDDGKVFKFTSDFQEINESEGKQN